MDILFILKECFFVVVFFFLIFNYKTDSLHSAINKNEQ